MTNSLTTEAVATPTDSNAQSVARQIKRKAAAQSAPLDQLARQLGVTLKELAPLLQISESTLHRFRRQKEVKGSTAERIELIDGIIRHGLRVYDGDAQALQAWLRYPLGELDGKTPLESLTTIVGFTQVDDVLGRIEHGVFL